MTSEITHIKVKFNRTLEPFKVMLVNRRAQLSHTEWIDLVNRTKEGVLTQPDQYLGKDLPHADTLFEIVDKIFIDFLKEQSH